VAAALLLPPELVALVAVVQHVPGWLERRFPLRMQAFNVASMTLAALAVRLSAHEIHVRQPFGRGGATSALIGAVACVVFVCVSDGLRVAAGEADAQTRELRPRSRHRRDRSRARGFRRRPGAAVRRHDAWLVLFVVAPLFLIQRSLAVPVLEAEAGIDAKTGLYNAHHFASALREELDRATRIGRPMSVVMADLDHLRDINNTHGHLAGDAVIAGIADIFRAELREYDVAARFGGEEFSLILPETGAEQALRIADRIRRAVGATLFAVPTSSDPRSRDDLDQRRVVPEGREGRGDACPQGRRRGLSREGPGPEPRRSVHAAAARCAARSAAGLR
jgi:diguanylate cyclase (GGDEF)-like protein